MFNVKKKLEERDYRRINKNWIPPPKPSPQKTVFLINEI